MDFDDIQIDYNVPAFTLTTREMAHLMEQVVKNYIDEALKQRDNPSKEYVYGIDGLAKILGCSKTTAQTIKSSGILDKAIIQNGRKIIIDKEQALELFKQNSNGNR